MIQYSSDMMLAEYDIECASYAYESTMIDVALGEADQSSADMALESVKKTNDSWFTRFKASVKSTVVKIKNAVKKLFERIKSFFTKKKLKSDTKKLDANSKKMIAAGAAVVLIPASIAIFLKHQQIQKLRSLYSDLSEYSSNIYELNKDLSDSNARLHAEKRNLYYDNINLQNMVDDLKRKTERLNDDAIHWKNKAEMDRTLYEKRFSSELYDLKLKETNARLKAEKYNKKYNKAASILATLAKIVSNSPLDDADYREQDTQNDPRIIEMSVENFANYAKSISNDATALADFIDKYGFSDEGDTSVSRKIPEDIDKNTPYDESADKYKRRALLKLVESATKNMQDRVRVANGVMQANEIINS